MSEADEIVAEVVEIREDDDSLSVTYHCTCVGFAAVSPSATRLTLKLAEPFAGTVTDEMALPAWSVKLTWKRVPSMKRTLLAERL